MKGVINVLCFFFVIDLLSSEFICNKRQSGNYDCLIALRMMTNNLTVEKRVKEAQLK